MLKKTITYTNFNDEVVTEDYYFNLSAAEIAEMQMIAGEEGLEEKFKRIINSKDGKAIIDTFKEIISLTVGIRSEDGRHFKKSPEISDNFMNSAAYSELFFELVTNATAAIEFATGVVPAKLAVGARSAMEAELEGVPDPKPPKKLSEYTMDELREMPLEDFKMLISKNKHGISHDILVLAMQRSASNS